MTIRAYMYLILLLASNGAQDFSVRKIFLINILTPKAYIELIKYRETME